MIYQREIQIQITGHREMHDLTDEIAQIVSASRIRAGVANVFNAGSTGGIGTIEFEPGLQQDLPVMLDRLFPPSREYGHEQAWHDGNGHSHLQATVLGKSLDRQGWLRAMFYTHEASRTIYIVDLFWKKTNKVTVADLHRINHRISQLKSLLLAGRNPWKSGE